MTVRELHPASSARRRVLAAALALPWGLAHAVADLPGNRRDLPAPELLKRLQAAGGEPIGVMFPDIGDPFRRNIIEIIEGIEDQARLKVHSFALATDANPADIAGAAKRSGTRVMIAIGGRALKLASALDLPVVLSGVNTIPDGERQIGISFTPDPALLFGHVKGLLPLMKRVQVVYNPANSDSQLRLARDAARGQGLELAPVEARDLAGAARQYEQLFASIDGKREGLWLPHDNTTVEEATILPIILREAWNRSVPVFSNSFAHVSKGVLFALKPNNVELGRSLAVLALGVLGGEARRGMSPLRDVLTAINHRTATHVGVNLTPKQLRNFDFIYPES